MRSIISTGCAVGVLVLGLAGCGQLPKRFEHGAEAALEALGPALTFTALATDGQVYYSASVEASSVSLQNILRALGLRATVTSGANGTVRIASATPDGSKFVLVVEPAPASGGGQRSRVFVEWETPAESGTGFKVLIELETKKRGQAASNPPAAAATPATR
jgi:hypothetical protein